MQGSVGAMWGVRGGMGNSAAPSTRPPLHLLYPPTRPVGSETAATSYLQPHLSHPHNDSRRWLEGHGEATSGATAAMGLPAGRARARLPAPPPQATPFEQRRRHSSGSAATHGTAGGKGGGGAVPETRVGAEDGREGAEGRRDGGGGCVSLPPPSPAAHPLPPPPAPAGQAPSRGAPAAGRAQRAVATAPASSAGSSR